MKLAAQSVSFAYLPEVDVLRDVSLHVEAGEVLFLLGANGSGKTTLIECLAGVRSPRTGKILLDGKPLERFSISERARRIGLVPQLHEPVFSYTVADVVLMGRAPHLGLFARPGRHDLLEVRKALESVGLWSLRRRPYTRTSGGERQLTLIARGLAQGATCLLMDEPAAHLDPHHQHEVFRVVQRLAAEGFAFAVTSHHPNNALLYGDSVVLLIDGAAVVQANPDQAITEGNLEAVYGLPFELVKGESGSRAVIPRTVTPTGQRSRT